MATRPLILLTNDDGINAPGLATLVSVARELGDVVVVAPDSPQSGQGHAITLEDPLRIHRVELFDGIEAYECTGTPVDCVKLAKHVVADGRPFALCASGINHGSNAGVNVIYSGTMSAAMEASLEGVPSVGFSLLDYRWEADFSVAIPYVREVMERGLRDGFGKAFLLNVNIPKGTETPIQGLKVCRQADARWVENFQEGIDPRGQKYYWLTGAFVPNDVVEGTDIYALDRHFVSVVPCGHDLTHYAALDSLRDLERGSFEISDPSHAMTGGNGAAV